MPGVSNQTTNMNVWLTYSDNVVSTSNENTVFNDVWNIITNRKDKI